MSTKASFRPFLQAPVGTLYSDDVVVTVWSLACQPTGEIISLNCTGRSANVRAVAQLLRNPKSHSPLTFKPRQPDLWTGPTTLAHAEDAYGFFKQPLVSPYVNSSFLASTANIAGMLKRCRTALPGSFPSVSEEEKERPLSSFPRYVLGAANAVCPPPGAAYGHWKAMQLVCRPEWEPLLWQMGVDAGLITPLPALGISCWQIAADAVAWKELIKHGRGTNQLPLTQIDSPTPLIPPAPAAHPKKAPVSPTLIEAEWDESLEHEIYEALLSNGMHRTNQWIEATSYRPLEIPPPIMPLLGKTHLAALILIGVLDGQVLTGPDANQYIFSSFISTRWQDQVIEDEERLKHVIKKRIMQDLPILGVLNCATGDTSYYAGADAYTFLNPWLPSLSQRISDTHRPRYTLNARDWMVRVALTIGRDKRLRGAAHPGLSPSQMHRVFAHWTAFDVLGKSAFAGKPGVGKTRMILALMALMTHYWVHRDDPDFEENRLRQPRPKWVKNLRRAWKTNQWTHSEAPIALPLAVAVPPHNVRTWIKEATGAWPEAKTLVIRSHRDVRHWLDLCATGKCVEQGTDEPITRTFPAVIAIFKHSTTRPVLLKWRPAVIEVPKGQREIVDLDAPGEPVVNAVGRLIGKRNRETGEIITKSIPISHFYCPDCGQQIQARPYGSRKDDPLEDEEEILVPPDEEELRPVEHIAWFHEQPRRCSNRRTGKGNTRRSSQICGAPLWTWCRAADEKGTSHLPFAPWSQGAQNLPRGQRPITPPTEGEKETPKAHAQPRKKASRGVRILNEKGERGAALADSFSPYDYYARFFPRCAAFVCIDEAHKLHGRNTDVAQAGHSILRTSHTRTIASATPYPGDLGRFFTSWYRFAPEFWINLGISYSEAAKANREFGLVQQITRERVITKKGSPEVEVAATTRPAPGISARLLPYLLAYHIYMDVLDVGEHMPKRREIPVVVDMDDPRLAQQRKEWKEKLEQAHQELKEAQDNYAILKRTWRDESPALDTADMRQSEAFEQVQEAEERHAHLAACDLAGAYRKTVEGLRTAALRGNSTAQMMMGLLPGWMSTHPFEPAYQITKHHRGQWGEDEGHEVIFQSPTLDWEYLYPLERHCQQIVDDELAQIAEGSVPLRTRRVMVYYHQSQKRDVGKRLAWVLGKYNPWILTDAIAQEEREDAIKRAVAQGHNVILVPYLLVSEGLNLQELDTIIWYEMAQNMDSSEQGSGRLWRLGKNEEVRIYFLVYRGTVAHEKLIKVALSSGASSLFMGDSPEGGLASLVGTDQLTLAQIARRLENGDELRAAFERRDAEREAILKRGRTWIGFERDPLPEQIARIRAEGGVSLASHKAVLPDTRKEKREEKGSWVLPGFEVPRSPGFTPKQKVPGAAAHSTRALRAHAQRVPFGLWDLEGKSH